MTTRRRSATFSAPWGRSLKIISFSALAFPFVLAVVLLLVIPTGEKWAALLGPGVMVLIFGITALFCIRGFAIRQGDLWVRRLFWETRVPLGGLSRVRPDAEAMKGAWRTAGNGGLFAFSGWFRNKKLGKFQVWVTDPKRAVVLEFESRTPIVVSPDRPKAFVRALGFNRKGEKADS
jgi:hypothetical protein